ncbi:glycerophosphodiester phosphodiesterase [Rufibacter tibetensis]|uniref:Glycerophosphodiester phosphodiesterase n=1 Tax=Rufibacter tibetensis TaxID=512763 RepID=A0A0N7HXA3_9BACT|nr:glycerophosphodiester phosphodiesterase [Rufibacter tibetensis]
MVKDEFINNQVIAHRGAWKNTGATENSVSALQHAIRLGCAGSEFDVHMSSDSVLFIHHDQDVDGIHIEKTPAAELAKLKLPNGEFLPTLDAYLLAGLNQNKTKLILEIKPSAISKERGQALARKVVETVQKHKAQGWVDYISFDYAICQKVKELEPPAKVAYLNGEKAPAELAKDQLYGFDYNQSVLKKNPHWIEEAHKLGLTVNSWTVNSPEMMDWLLERKADFITTNEPELLLEKIKKLANN